MIGKREYKSSDAERERKRRYYRENKARLIAKAAQWKRDNPEAVQRHTAAYRERWRLELCIKAAGYFMRNSVAVLRRQRERYALAKELTYRRVST